MKKLFAALFLIIITIPFLSPRRAMGSDISIGGTLWYAWWIPTWKEQKGYPVDESKLTFDIDPSFLYGPVVSIKFLDNWSISVNYIQGKFKGIIDQKDYDPTSSTLYRYVFKVEALKYDFDSALNYSINRYIKIFAGMKILGYNYDIEMSDSGNGSILWIDKRKVKNKSQGPGLGISAMAPLSDNLFFIFNVSGIVLTGEEKREDEFIHIGGVNHWATTQDYLTDKRELKTYGGNLTLSFAYYIPGLNITLLTGGRYQLLKYSIRDYDESLLKENRLLRSANYDGKIDHFFGANLSVVYSINL